MLIPKYTLTYEGIVVDKIVELLRAYSHAADESALVFGLLLVGNATFFNEIDHTVAENLRVDAEVFVVAESAEYSVGDVADTELEGSAVLDQPL